MAKKDQPASSRQGGKNEVKETEKKAEAEAEAEGEAELKKDSAEQEAGSNPDEKAQEGAAVEEAAGAEEETPSEVEAVNTDNRTAQSATRGSAFSGEATKAEAPKEEPQPKVEKSAPKKEEPKPKPTGKFKDLIKEIEGLTTLELAELVKALEERFGVSAAAPVAMAPLSGTAGGAGAPEEEEKANYTVVLADSGAQKIAVIKALREINQELGLKEAKDIADTPPKEIKKDIPKAEAEEAKKKLEAAGAKVELK